MAPVIIPREKLIDDIAVLYVDSKGIYPSLVVPENLYDEARDARTYAGPWPVVAHPPCGPWSSLRHLHTHPEERELGLCAVRMVRRYGGVLEQPAGSTLWEAAGLPMPGHRVELGGHRTVWCIEVEQVHWGHPARKRTWLYCVGVNPYTVAWPPLTGKPTHWCSGGRTKRPGMGATVPPGIKVCSAQQRRRTPPAFAAWLIALARQARRP